MQINADQFYESLQGLLPQGFAWPRHPDSVWMRLIRSEAEQLAQHTDDVHAMVRQWQPHTTVARLAQWEESCGLPDKCLGNDQSESDRRKVLLRTLRGVDLPLEDSSPAALKVIEAECERLGFEVSARYNWPMRVGAPVGTVLGDLDGKLFVVVSASSEPMRVGLARVGDRLVERDLPDASLSCVLERIVPARFSINLFFE